MRRSICTVSAYFRWITAAALLAVIPVAPRSHAQSPPVQSLVPADPQGILRKPIPDKLIVLTFDDSPVSGYTVVAPILKANKFGGTFYITDFDSFYTRKDWYLTWRQMQAMTIGPEWKRRR